MSSTAHDSYSRFLQRYFETLFLEELIPLNCVCHKEDVLFSWPFMFCTALSACELVGCATTYIAVLSVISRVFSAREFGLGEVPNQPLGLLVDAALPRKVAASFLAAPSRLLERYGADSGVTLSCCSS